MRVSFLLRSLALVGAIAGALAVAPVTAGATTVTLSKQESSIFGTNGHSNVKIMNSPSGVMWVAAGGFALTDGSQNFTAWCLDIATWIRLPSLYSETSTPFPTAAMTATQISNVKQLFRTAFATLNLSNNALSAGFQLALWELVNETGSTFDLSTGNFTAWDNAAAVQAGNAFLAGLSGPVTGQYRFTFLASNDPREPDGHYSQNLITVSPIPLPAAGLLMVLALGSLAGLRRRSSV